MNTTFFSQANIDPRILAIVGKVNSDILSAAKSHAKDAEAAAIKGDWTRTDLYLKLADETFSRIHGRPVKYTAAHQAVNVAKWASLANKKLPK